VRLTEKKLMGLCKEYRMSSRMTEKIVAEAMSKYANVNFDMFEYRLAGGGMERIFSKGDIELRFIPYIPADPMGAGYASYEQINFDDGEHVHVFHQNGAEQRHLSPIEISRIKKLQQQSKKDEIQQPVQKKCLLSRIFARGRGE